ncbi:MAG: ArsR family transcriptional regulator [Bacteroidetes bacterium]|nr:ArsR family transcriptional regulator [Bacteroidota bacterium]MDA1120836.1 ArsR family transcriptional regulator [Bacteroidota bacterium]
MNTLESLITSKTRLKLLLKFFSNTHTKSYLRSLSEEFGESTNSVRVELNRLSEAGFLESSPRGNTIVYKANKNHPLFPEISGIVSKHLGLDGIIDQVVNKLGDLKQACVVGDYAKGKDTGLIDLVLVGNIDQVYLQKLVLKAETLIHRKIRTLTLQEEELESFEGQLNLIESIILYSRV